MNRKRLTYLLATIIFLLIEIVIALYVHDNFIRPYLGDVLVVVVIYTFLRIFIPEKLKHLPIYIFLFATAVEILQYFKIVEILGLENNKFMSVLIGSTFDGKDIVCYGIGCLLLSLYEIRSYKRKHS